MRLIALAAALATQTACAAREPPRVAVAAAEKPPPPPPAEPAPPALPPSWRSGSFSGAPPPAVDSVRWTLRLDRPVIAPLAVDDLGFYAISGPALVAVTPGGELAWRARVDPSGTPLCTGGTCWIGTRDGPVLAIRHDRGWVERKLAGGGAIRGSPVQLGGEIAWVTREGVLASEGGWFVEAALSAAAGPAAGDGTAWFCTLEGELAAVRNRELAWSVALPGPCVHHPVYDGRTVLVPVSPRGGRPGGIAAFDGAGGERSWFQPTSDPPVASPSLCADGLLVPDRGGVVSLLAPDAGRVLWETALPGHPSTRVAVRGQRAWVGTTEGELWELDLDDGGAVGSVDLGSSVSGDPAVGHGLVVVGLADGRVVALGSGRRPAAAGQPGGTRRGPAAGP